MSDEGSWIAGECRAEWGHLLRGTAQSRRDGGFAGDDTGTKARSFNTASQVE
jgi:hypothetical protein